MKLMWKPFLPLVVLTVATIGAAGCNHTQDRSDAEIAAEIQGKVGADQVVQNKQIAVQAAKGVVTLSGAVASEEERSAAAADAASVAGVRTVVNNLSVAPPEPEPQAAVEQPAPAAVSKSYAPKTRTRDRHQRYERAHDRRHARNARPSYAQAPSYSQAHSQAKPRY